MDLAGRPGFNSAYTKIGIYVDGVKIGSDQSTSTWSALNWQTRTFQFVGNGGSQTLRIVSEASAVSANGYGMMIDDIALTEALPANTGLEDTAIKLSAISALKDTDGFESLTLTLEDIPVGKACSLDGTRSFTATAGNTAADLTAGPWPVEPDAAFELQRQLRAQGLLRRRNRPTTEPRPVPKPA